MKEFTYTAEVLYNVERDEQGRLVGIAAGWEPEHELHLVWRYKVSDLSPERALEQVWVDFNRVDGPCLADAAGVRSLSIGDVVTLWLGDEFGELVGSYAVATVGWNPIRTKELNAR